MKSLVVSDFKESKWLGKWALYIRGVELEHHAGTERHWEMVANTFYHTDMTGGSVPVYRVRERVRDVEGLGTYWYKVNEFRTYMEGLGAHSIWTNTKTEKGMEIRPSTGIGWLDKDVWAKSAYSIRSQVIKEQGYELPKNRKYRTIFTKGGKITSLDDVWTNLRKAATLEEAKEDLKRIAKLVDCEYDKDVMAKKLKNRYIKGLIHTDPAVKAAHKLAGERRKLYISMADKFTKRAKLSSVLEKLSENNPIMPALKSLFEMYGNIFIRRSAAQELVRGGVFEIRDRFHWPEQIRRGYREKDNASWHSFWDEHPEFQQEFSMDRGRDVIKEDGSKWRYDAKTMSWIVVEKAPKDKWVYHPKRKRFVMRRGPITDPRPDSTYIEAMGDPDNLKGDTGSNDSITVGVDYDLIKATGGVGNIIDWEIENLWQWMDEEGNVPGWLKVHPRVGDNVFKANQEGELHGGHLKPLSAKEELASLAKTEFGKALIEAHC